MFTCPPTRPTAPPAATTPARQLPPIPVLVVMLLATALPATPLEAHARQDGRIYVPSVRSLEPLEACSRESGASDSTLDRVSGILSSTRPLPGADSELRSLEAEARRRLESAPDDPAAAYRLTAVLGARTDLAEGREQLRLADDLQREARRVLELDPRHAGAHHVLGRLNAAAMRLGGLQRFLARHLLGGSLLEEASWERARRHLEVAEAGDPCRPEHHYELARLYLERGDPAGAWEEVGHVLRLTERDHSRWDGMRARAEALVAGRALSRSAPSGSPPAAPPAPLLSLRFPAGGGGSRRSR